MPKEILKEIADKKAFLHLIEVGKYEFKHEMLEVKFDMVVLNEDEVLEVVRATNGFDTISKFPFMKKETLIRSIKKIDGDEMKREVVENFLGWLPDILIDALYLEYDKNKKLRDLKIEQMMDNLKNSAGSQTQEGSGSGQNSPDLSGSEDSTQSPHK